MIALVSLLLLAAPADPPAQVGRVLAAPRPISRVWLRGVGLDADALAQAVAARLADKQILGAGADAGPIEGPVALCRVAVDGGDLQLEVILSDGRVYQRTIGAPVDGRERTAARLIASTIASIEDETATPDRRDGVFVAPVAEPVVPVPVVEPPAKSVTPEMPVEPRREPVEVVPVAPPVKLRAPLELGLAIAGEAALGLGLPAAGLGFAGAGGQLRVDLRLRRGALLGAGFRGLGRVRDELSLGRYRGGVFAGYVFRRRALEVSALAGPTLETWQVREHGAPVAYAASGAGGASLLFGGLARLGLGGRISATRRLALRVGGYLEFAGSARSSGRAAQIARRHGGAAPVFVLGGAELSIGVEVELWFALLGKRDRAARR